ncbi:MAG: hypothetical protein M1829_002750 [Trizodia sp. TS-e1964]|nr:MAG: hypothetical protein M1829_002750 [Trizodia sp. TS-e1964]
MTPTQKNESSSTPSPTADTQVSNKAAVVVGIYGVPGSGKTFLLDQLKQKLGEERFEFYEGAKMIAAVVTGGLDTFHKLEEPEKLYWRQQAIDRIGKKCAASGRVAVVAGHFMFWPEGEEAGRVACTQNDLDTFTHILYLDVPPEIVAQRRIGDKERSRPSISVTHLRKWQQAEKTQLRHLCRNHNILFSLVSPSPVVLNKVLTLIQDFRRHTEEYNLSQAESMLDKALDTRKGRLDTVLVMDADRTLAAEDTGALFWERISRSQRPRDGDYPLKKLFSSPLGYSHTAFRQATLLYEESADDQEFDALCQEVASAVRVHPEFTTLLKLVAGQEHVGAVIVTCGLRRVWEKVLERDNLSKAVKVIGGGRIEDGIVVTAAVKAGLVSRLQDIHQIYVWAFGDSVLDLEMLMKADQAVVVVGEEQTRSKTMDAALARAIDNGLQARQVLLPSSAFPRLDATKLPLIQLTEHEFIDSILCRQSQNPGIQVLHATEKNAAKLFMTPMRDESISGPLLRKYHRSVGYYLANEYLSEVIGIEEYPIRHVQGYWISGYRLLHERQTLIIALMRGGEAMALGVSEAFPLAMFLHGNRPDDIKLHHLAGQSTVLLVDSVVNSGKTVAQFVHHIHKLNASIRIVVVTGVAQGQSIAKGSHLAQAQAGHPNLSFVALRLSDNKFTGSGTTDTGNRLFNTTHLP